MSSPGDRVGEFLALPAGGSLKDLKKGGARIKESNNE